MGAFSSKTDNLKTVPLSRGRSKCLSKAIGFRYAFSDAHIAYFRSLKSVSASFNKFIDGIDTMCNITGSVNPQFPSEQKDENARTVGESLNQFMEEGIPDLEDVEDSTYASAHIDEEISKESNEAVDDNNHTNENFKIGIDVKQSIDNDDKLGAAEDNIVTSDVGEMVEEKTEDMLRIKCYNNLSKLSAAVRSQFDKASESAPELTEIIEVGNLQYHQKLCVHKSVTCKGFDVQAFLKSVISGKRSHLSAKNHLLIAEDDEGAHSSLSSTLQKLVFCETKLYDEVMKKEKIQFSFGKTCKEMGLLFEKSVEQQKLDPFMPVLKKLVKITLTNKLICFLSDNIAILRDEILCPQVCRLIKGLARMWGSMYECYETLHQAIPEENILQSFSYGDESFSDAQIESTKQLGLQLIEWMINFSTWIKAQKDFIKALNGWLLIAASHAEEETADRVAPFSLSILGPPSIFVICDQWDEAIQQVSEEEVIISMQSFSSAVIGLWKKQKDEQRQKLLVNKGMEKEMMFMEKEEKEMRRIVKAQSKRLMHVSGQNGITMFKENVEECHLHSSLRQMFESMRNYCAANLKVYEELSMCIEDEGIPIN